jgi:hypothetical protein
VLAKGDRRGFYLLKKIDATKHLSRHPRKNKDEEMP